MEKTRPSAERAATGGRDESRDYLGVPQRQSPAIPIEPHATSELFCDLSAPLVRSIHLSGHHCARTNWTLKKHNTQELKESSIHRASGRE
jgi:hypothetical protein